MIHELFFVNDHVSNYIKIKKLELSLPAVVNQINIHPNVDDQILLSDNLQIVKYVYKKYAIV